MACSDQSIGSSPVASIDGNASPACWERRHDWGPSDGPDHPVSSPQPSDLPRSPARPRCLQLTRKLRPPTPHHRLRRVSLLCPSRPHDRLPNHNVAVRLITGTEISWGYHRDEVLLPAAVLERSPRHRPPTFSLPKVEYTKTPLHVARSLGEERGYCSKLRWHFSK